MDENSRDVGSSFDDFLETRAIKRVIVWQLDGTKRAKVTKADLMGQRLGRREETVAPPAVFPG